VQGRGGERKPTTHFPLLRTQRAPSSGAGAAAAVGAAAILGVALGVRHSRPVRHAGKEMARARGGGENPVHGCGSAGTMTEAELGGGSSLSESPGGMRGVEVGGPRGGRDRDWDSGEGEEIDKTEGEQRTENLQQAAPNRDSLSRPNRMPQCFSLYVTPLPACLPACLVVGASVAWVRPPSQPRWHSSPLPRPLG
jgi:hypothetical protein